LNAFADTSLLCALYREQDNSQEADRLIQQESSPVHVSSLVLFEFRQSLRLQAFRFSQDRTQGFSKTEAHRMLEILQANIVAGLLMIPPIEDWAKVYSIAEELSAQHTIQGGHRSFDLLHVATALHVKAGRFMTFDTRQAALAKAAGLKVST
jgi:predicted nucleic acid-binding protein